MIKSITNEKTFGKSEMTQSYSDNIAKFLMQEVTCPDCGKTMTMEEWPKFKSNGRPKRTCCKTTGWNGKQKYLDRQKLVNGEVLFLCYSCKEHRHENKFYRQKGLVSSQCKLCHSEKYKHYKSKKTLREESQAKIRRIKRENEKLECKDCGKSIMRKHFPKDNSGRLAKRCCAERTLANINNALRKRGLKFCNHCGLVKLLDNFNKSTRGHQNYCKLCKKAIQIRNQYNLKRANRIAGTDDGTLNTDTLKVLFVSQNSCCVCGNQMKYKDKTLDHLTPLKLGGRHTISNAIIMCHSCNSSKGSKSPKKWFDTLSEESKKSVSEYFSSRPELDIGVLQ